MMPVQRSLGGNRARPAALVLAFPVWVALVLAVAALVPAGAWLSPSVSSRRLAR
jgi:hypothetical protein